MVWELADRSDNRIVSGSDSKDLYSLIRVMRHLNPQRAEAEYRIVVFDADGAPERLRLEEVLRG